MSRRDSYMSEATTAQLTTSSDEEYLYAPSPHAPPRELLFKVLIIGDFGVGKTAIVKRFTEGRFSSSYKITIGADFAIKQLRWDRDTKINLQLWDIAGHERFGYMTRVYYKYAVAAAVVFDVSRIATFQSVHKWVLDVREKVTLPDGTAVPLVLLANKCDISDAVVPAETVARFCREHGIAAWYVTSAKDNINIDEAIHFLVSQVLQVKSMEASRDHIVLQDSTSGESDCSAPMFTSKSSPCSCG